MRQVSPAHAAASVQLPKAGRSPSAIWATMDEARQADVQWQQGRVAALVYLPGDDVVAVAKEAYLRFFSENGLSPRAFPSIDRFEREVVAMTAALLHGEHALGNITSGGTESIILALKIARDKARAEHPEITEPEIVLPETAHPAFNKGAHYLGLKAIRTPVGPDFQLDLDAYRDAVTDNTVLLVGSAPNYPFGMIDPISEMAEIAAERRISFHVDACVGGYFLPFLERLGTPITPFDFRVPGVTTISADLHKFGFAARGASVLLCRDADIYQYQGVRFTDWPSGIYSTPTLAGSRPGGAIAAAWAVMQYLGEEGYVRLTQQAMRAATRLQAGIRTIPGFQVFGEPVMSVFAFGSPERDMAAVAAGMEARGWFVHPQRRPPGIHVMLSPGHDAFIDTYLADLRAVVDLVDRGQIDGAGREAMYS